MGFSMMCDRCGTHIKNVPVKQLQNFREEEVVCKRCQKAEDLAKKKIEAIKNKAQSELNQIASKYKDMVSEAVKMSVEEGGEE